MECKCRKIISILLALFILSSNICLTSCSSDEEDKVVNGRSCNVYDGTTTEIYTENGYNEILSAFYSDGYYYAVVFCIRRIGDNTTTLYRINQAGDIESSQELPVSYNQYAASDSYDGKFYYTTYDDRVEMLDLDSGEITQSDRMDSNILGVQVTSSNIYVLYQGRIMQYDYDWNVTGSIDNLEWSFYNMNKPVYEHEGKLYAIAGDFSAQTYYELDFENSSSETVFNPRSAGYDYAAEYYGQYMFDKNGEYLLDLDDFTRITLADWNGINMPPPSYNTLCKYSAIDNEHFIVCYNYDVGLCEMQIYTYNPDEDYSDKEAIVIGGFDCRDDVALNWAVYNFNTSQDEYRAYIEDYTIEFGWDGVGDVMDQQAALIQYFNEGNAPDIYYGDEFDYELFANNGTTIDMSQYLGEEFTSKMNTVTPSIRNLMINEDGSCNRLFAGYQMGGFIGVSSIVGDEQEVSIQDIEAMKDLTGGYVYNGELAEYIASEALMSSVSTANYSEEDIERILQYAYDYGLEGFPNYYDDFSVATKDYYLLWHFSFFDLYYVEQAITGIRDRLTFIGYPTLDDSIHLVDPFGQMAVSSSAEHPEKCVELALHLFDENVQMACVTQCLVPVNDTVLENWFADSMNHRNISSDDIGYQLTIKQIPEVSQETVDDFRAAINSADAVSCNDSGLYCIIYEEVESYYSQGKPVGEIAKSLHSRINLYLSERQF